MAPELPKNLEAERAILGTILLQHAIPEQVSSKLIPSEFFDDRHIKIYRAMQTMDAMGVRIEDVSFIEQLHDDPPLIAYLSSLADGRQVVTNLSYYANLVKEKSLLRRLIHSAADIEREAFAGEDPTTILDRAGKIFTDLRASQSAATCNLFDSWEEFKNAKPLRSLIKDFLQADCCNMIGGLSGDGKTMILFSIAKALLSGNPLFGFFPVLEPAEKVVYLIPESARAPFFHRVKLFRLEPYLETGKLLVRTLSKGPKIPLDDPRLLSQVKDSVVILDTAARFGEGSENDASDVASGLANDIFGLLQHGAVAVEVAHHAPKGFEKENRITLEGILRGSGDFGAFIGAGFGIRQIDENENIIHVEDIKSRDTTPTPPFQIIGRPCG